MSKADTASDVVRIYVNVNGEKDEVIQFSRLCTQEEMINVFRAAADFPPIFGVDGDPQSPSGQSNEPKVLMTLKNSNGDTVRICPDIPPNSSDPADRYRLMALDEESLSAVMETTADVKVEEVIDLKRNLELLKKKLDDYEKLQLLPGVVPPRQFKRAAKGNSRFATRSKYIFTEETKSELKLPSFDMWDWDENEMIGLLEHMFSDLDLVKEFEIDLPTLRRFLNAIRESYNHNAYAIMQVTGVVEKLKPIDKLIMMLSAVGH
ncbi:High affinity cAMP-specific and IBMX-insensitive 3',5'-cyclic phosphodiesterase 9A, partial [Phlyctochytrium bullatum]